MSWASLDALSRARDARVAADVARRVGGGRWVLAVGVLAAAVLLGAAVARARDAGPADGSPMHPPHACDAVCIHFTCASHCASERDSLCYRACSEGLWRECGPCRFSDDPEGRP